VRGGPESGVRCRPPFSHAVRGSARSEGPGSRTARRGLGAWTNSDEALGVRSHSRVVRARHVSTSQLTLGRSPDNREYGAVRRFSSLRPRRSGFTKDLPPKPAFFVVLWRGGVRVRGTCFLGSKVATPATKTVAAPYSKFPCRPSTRRTVFSNHRQCVLAINSSCAPVGKKMAAGWMRGKRWIRRALSFTVSDKPSGWSHRWSTGQLAGGCDNAPRPRCSHAPSIERGEGRTAGLASDMPSDSPPH
jgi:hypothetical protein